MTDQKMQPVNGIEGEKGAALVMVLMLSTLLLAAVGGLLLEVSMNTANVTDATAEQQAYNAAESGIQSTLNVLRGNTVPSVLIDSSKPASDPANRIDFRKAVTKSTSNLSGDPSVVARLSRWMTYNYPAVSPTADRVTLNSGYQPQTGYAFDVTVTDPDDTGNIVSFNTQGKFLDLDGVWKSTVQIGSAPNLANLVYIPNTVNSLNVAGGAANTNFGSFRLIPLGIGAVVLGQDLRFQIIVNLTAPYTGTKVLSGSLKIGIDLFHPIKFEFDSTVFQITGSTITLDNNPVNVNLGGITVISGKISAVEPYRLVISSVGYGPRGAKKVLEATIQKNFFNGMSAPATVTLVGASGAGFVFDPGTSAAMVYSGQDVINSALIIPPIGTSNDANLGIVNDNLRRPPVGTPANVNVEMPFWLQSAANLNNTLQSLKTTAVASGRYYASGVTPPDIGNSATAKGITYVDGDLVLTGDGGGILVVSGKLTLRGAFNFNGLIVVTGANGVDRRSGGNGTLQGNLVVAPYNQANLSAGFLSPVYNLAGGGSSIITYNSSSVANGMIAVSSFVLAVAEK